MFGDIGERKAGQSLGVKAEADNKIISINI
jgi:hypothetical protein